LPSSLFLSSELQGHSAEDVKKSIVNYIEGSQHDDVSIIKAPNAILFGKLSRIGDVINTSAQKTVFGVALFGMLGFAKAQELAYEFKVRASNIDVIGTATSIQEGVSKIAGSTVGLFRSIKDNVVGEIEVTKKAFYDMKEFYRFGVTTFNEGLISVGDVKTNIIGSWLMIGKSSKIKKLKKRFANEFELLGINVDGSMSKFQSFHNSKLANSDVVESQGDILASMNKSADFFEKEFDVSFGGDNSGHHNASVDVSLNMLNETLGELTKEQKIEVVNKVVLPKLKKQIVKSTKLLNGLYDSFVSHPHVKILDSFAQKNEISLGAVIKLLGASPDLIKDFKGSDRILRERDHILTSIESEMYSVIKATSFFSKNVHVVASFVEFLPKEMQVKALLPFGSMFSKNKGKTVQVGVLDIVNADVIGVKLTNKMDSMRRLEDVVKSNSKVKR